jgi:hypothetical protein
LRKDGPKRHRKVLRDYMQGITKPGLRHLARRGVVKQKQKLTAGNQPVRLFVVSGPVGTSEHIFVHSKTNVFFLLLGPPFRQNEGLVFLIRGLRIAP